MKVKAALLILYFIVSCKSVEIDKNEKQLQVVGTEKLTLIAVEKYKKDYSIKFNSNKDFALCIHISKSNIPGPESINFFVYDLSHDKITYESNISKGNVSWNSEYEIIMEEIPGAIQKNVQHTNIYIFNVITKAKTKINGDVR